VKACSSVWEFAFVCAALSPLEQGHGAGQADQRPQLPKILTLLVEQGQLAAPGHRVLQVRACSVAGDAVLAPEVAQSGDEAAAAVGIPKAALQPLRAVGEKKGATGRGVLRLWRGRGRA
jgi:hypothetical protein